MQNRKIIITSLLAVALLLSACAAKNNQNEAPVGTVFPEGALEETQQAIPETGSELEPTTDLELETEPTPTLEPTLEPTVEPVETQEPEDEFAVPEAVPTEDKPVQPETDSQKVGESGLIGIPETGSGGLVGLPAMFGFEVVDANGNEIGTVRDFVVNMCEAHILYMVVDPSGAAAGAGRQQLLIPYQATLETPNNGAVDVSRGQFIIDLDASELGESPFLDVTGLDMQEPEWDAEVLAYWSSDFELALTAGCPVPVSGGEDDSAGADDDGNVETQTVYRIGLASEILSAELQDGNGQLLGVVRDIAIVPETGRTQFVVVDAESMDQSAGHLAALPPGAVNLQYNSTGQPVLVLLVETQVFEEAPPFNITDNMTDSGWFDYWDQYIPMTLEQLP